MRRNSRADAQHREQVGKFFKAKSKVQSPDVGAGRERESKLLPPGLWFLLLTVVN